MKKIISITLSLIILLSISILTAAKPKPNRNNKVLCYISIQGKQLDVQGNISQQDKQYFTDVVATSTLSKPLYYNIAIGNNITEKDILSYISNIPSSNVIFKNIINQYKNSDAYIYSSNNKRISWSNLNTDNYKIQWYVLKQESEAWHMDGIIIDLQTNKEISIIVPDSDVTHSTCLKYDVINNTYISGTMSTKQNRPHSYHYGNNDVYIVEGFEDVWYTVLDENSFIKNDYFIPQYLIDAANNIYKTCSSRLNELSPSLQNQYGRIDSEAYKRSYINRNGLNSLYITPFINDILIQQYNISYNKYMWLAIGDCNGNINRIYLMIK